jgi:hypothetical protein
MYVLRTCQRTTSLQCSLLDWIPSSCGANDVDVLTPIPAPLARTHTHATHTALNPHCSPYAVPSLDKAAVAYISSVRTRLGFVYLQSAGLPNPWDVLPTYFEGLLSTLVTC